MPTDEDQRVNRISGVFRESGILEALQHLADGKIHDNALFYSAKVFGPLRANETTTGRFLSKTAAQALGAVQMIIKALDYDGLMPYFPPTNIVANPRIDLLYGGVWTPVREKIGRVWIPLELDFAI
ncbi:MAG: hypothetical protein AABX33_06540 [Nanoarchaeota archaeon]